MNMVNLQIENQFRKLRDIISLSIEQEEYDIINIPVCYCADFGCGKPDFNLLTANVNIFTLK